jgi:hypothetical protein
MKKYMSENFTDNVMAVGCHNVDAETKSLLEQLDVGTITHEEVIKCIQEATEKMSTKVVRTQAEIDEFYED